MKCRIDGFAMPCAMVFGMKERGSVIDAPVEEVTTMRFRNQVTGEIRYALGIYGPLPDGGAGFVPAGARFDEGNFYTVGLGMAESGPGLGIGRAVNIAGSGRYDSFGHGPGQHLKRQDTTKRGQMVYSEVKDKRGGSRLPFCAREILKEIGFGKFVNLDDIRLHIGIPKTITDYAAINVGALTIGNDIYYPSLDDYRPTTPEGIAKLGHELVHSMQYRILGDDAFLTKYFAEYAANRLNGMSPEQAYANISLEKKASNIEVSLLERIKGQYGTDPCKDFR